MFQEHVASQLSLEGRLQRHHFLQRHPLLTPLLFLAGSALLCVASYFTDALFPLLAIFGIPSLPFCLSLAFVLGISGILISIINLIECIDRHSFKVALFPKPKEHSYASN
jgi:hypothetical protein